MKDKKIQLCQQKRIGDKRNHHLHIHHAHVHTHVYTHNIA